MATMTTYSREQGQHEVSLEPTLVPPPVVASEQLPPAETLPSEPPTSDTPPAPGSEEEAAVTADTPRANRPFVSRLIRDNQRYQDRVTTLEAQLAFVTRQTPVPGPATPLQEARPASDDRPDPNAFVSHDEYILALGRWGARQEVRAHEQAREAESTATRQAREQREAQTEWQTMERTGRTQYEDFDEVVNQAAFEPALHATLNYVVRRAEKGAELLYYLGQHPTEVQALNALPPLDAARWLGLLEARLVPPKAPPPVVPRSTPPPLSPVQGNGALPPVQDAGSIAERGGSLRDYRLARHQERMRR